MSNHNPFRNHSLIQSRTGKPSKAKPLKVCVQCRVNKVRDNRAKYCLDCIPVRWTKKELR